MRPEKLLLQWVFPGKCNQRRGNDDLQRDSHLIPVGFRSALIIARNGAHPARPTSKLCPARQYR